MDNKDDSMDFNRGNDGDDFDHQDDRKIKLTRRPYSKILQVCPNCLSILEQGGSFINIIDRFRCPNEECGWVGSFCVEVNREDYKKFLEEHSASN